MVLLKCSILKSNVYKPWKIQSLGLLRAKCNCKCLFLYLVSHQGTSITSLRCLTYQPGVVQVKQCQPGISFSDTSKELGRLWREASVRTKAVYGEKAKADRVRISKAIMAYRAHLQELPYGP